MDDSLSNLQPKAASASNDKIVARQARERKAAEKKLFRELKKVYKQIEEGIMDEAERQLANSNVNGLVRTQSIQHLVRTEMQRFVKEGIVPLVSQGMVETNAMGAKHAEELITVQVPNAPLNILPTLALTEMVRYMTFGPIGDLLASFGPDAEKRARKVLTTSLALGHNHRKTASYLRKALGVSRSRALLIARTETNRAHREGNRHTYNNNKHIVKSWVWHASPSARTCAACWALHGQEFPLNESMAAHPACRCTLVPKVKTWREMGYDIDGDSVIEDGESLFKKQSVETQKAVLGSGYERYKSGEVTLRDFVATRHSAYGKTYVKRIPK